jgi:hypothetical protein
MNALSLSRISKQIPLNLRTSSRKQQSPFQLLQVKARFLSSSSSMAEAKEFPPQKIRAIVGEVAALLKERKETVSIAETVCLYVIPVFPFWDAKDISYSKSVDESDCCLR